MALKVAINGFGRIGRMVFRAGFSNPDIELVAINDLTDIATLAHLLKYDSVHGAFGEDVSSGERSLIINGKEIEIYSEKDPSRLPWGELGVETVFECTGLFRDRESASGHLDAGAEKVIISAPAKSPDITVVMGVNEQEYDAKTHHIVSNASCTTNCLAPVCKVLLDHFGIEKGLMTTTHAYTGDQRLLDFPHKDLRRARAAGLSMIPTTTGAAKAVALVLPQLDGKLNGMAIRVPTPNVSVVDLVVQLTKPTTADAVNQAMEAASKSSLKGILAYSDEPLVSIDFNGDACSSVIDGISTKVIENNMVKVLAWYDNEWGYSNRVKDLLKFIAHA